MCEYERLPENLMILRIAETIRSFADAKYIVNIGKSTEIKRVINADAIINPMAGMTMRFAKSAITENLLKYKIVKGNVPICAHNETAQNKITYRINLF